MLTETWEAPQPTWSWWLLLLVPHVRSVERVAHPLAVTVLPAQGGWVLLISWLFPLISSAQRGFAAGGVTSDSGGWVSSRPGRALGKGHGDSSHSCKDSVVLEKAVLLNGFNL